MNLKNKLTRPRQEWRDLEHDNPEEYRRRVAAIQSTIDRYNSEFGISDNEDGK
jgi:hypothetical protein